ncbi:FkbM family methyltransferase [Bradyrhizobium sp. sGM-13]|uniref:FkbM family methyltransferase n=1 Tax=Bradyrhizobium sp. sGM-13 TaxID=2831781 RepID=UPI001BCED207|nr:FkbM family methyltransferase [Bradyrhizobium sp. sGM-13]
MATQDLIFDVGCHRGEDSRFFLRKGFHVVAVEANPALCRELRETFSREMASGQFVLVEKAIAEVPGEVEFFVNSAHSIWGTIRGEFVERDKENFAKIVVPSVTFNSLLQCYGVPRYLKIDIEGADMLCLESLLSESDRPDFVSFESDRKTISALRSELSLLIRLGYRRFQLVDQKAVQKQEQPFPAREGLYADCGIAPDASGLFGLELPGHWLSPPGFVARYMRVMARDRLVGLARRCGLPNLIRGSWYDIHAAKES